MSTKISKGERTELIANLRERLSPGDTIHTSLIHVARSGMYRVIGLYVMQDNEPVNITYAAGKILEGIDERHGGAKAHGCGMDMGFHLVYSLSSYLWPEGWECNAEARPDGKCHSNDHSNDHSNGDQDYTPHHHHDGGYALYQRWL